MAYEKIVYIDFKDGNGFMDISHLVKYDTLNISRNAFNDQYKPAQSECSFSIVYDATVCGILTTFTEDLGVYVTQVVGASETPLFYGHIPYDRSWAYNGILENTVISLSAVDNLDYLNVAIGDVAYTGFAVCDPANPSVSLLHTLLGIAGWDMSKVSSSVTIASTIAKFAPNNIEDNVLAVLTELIYEYGYVLSLDISGNILPVQWNLPNTATTSFEFNDSNIVSEIQIKDKIRTYDGVDVTHYNLGYKEDVLVYRDEKCDYNDDGTFAGVSVPAGYYYPLTANVIDETTGTNQEVFQEYTDDSISYFTNKAIANGLDYNYKAFESDFSGILTTENHFHDFRADAGLTVQVATFYNKKAKILWRNTGASAGNIYYNNIYADVWYKTDERKVEVYPVGSLKKNVFEITLQYVFTKALADAYASGIAKQLEIGNITYKFTSEVYIADGAYIRVRLDNGIDSNALVQRVSVDGRTGLYEYQCVVTSIDRQAISAQHINESILVSTENPLTLGVSNSDLTVPYDSTTKSYDYSEVTSLLTVKRGGIDYTPDWSFSVVATGVTYTLVGNLLSVTDVTGSMGTLAITATRTGWVSLTAQITVNRPQIAEAIEDVISGTPTDIPNDPSNIVAVAYQEFIDVTWAFVGEGLSNTIARFNVWVSKNDGSTWTQLPAVSKNSITYTFDRDTDGYPEAVDLTDWRVRVKAVNIYGNASAAYGPSDVGQVVDLTEYLTWIPSVPVVSPYCNGREAVLSWGAGAQYGRLGYQAQIARKDTVPDEEDWEKPVLTLDPRASEENYSDGTTGSLFTTVEQISQSLPLHNQALGLPVDTKYYYRVRGVTAVPTSAAPDAVLVGTWSGAYPVLARPTGTMDLVEKAIKTAQLDDDAVTVEKLNVLAKNLVNPFTGEEVDAMPEGWTATGLSVCKIVASSEIGYHVLQIKSAADGSGHVVSDEFTVGPYDILELTVALMSDVAANVSVRPGAPGDAAYQTYRSVWNATNKSWGAFGNLSSGQLLIENVSPAGAYVAYKTYIVGSLVDPTQIPAPINVQYCVRMVAGQTAMKIHVVSYLSVATVCVGIPTLLKLGAGQLTANQILVRDLSSINAKLGRVLGDDPDAFNITGNSGYDTPAGTFLLGKATDSSYIRKWYDTATGTWKMAIKLATFFVDAISSKILGAFEVKNAADTVVNLSVDGTTGATNVSGGGDVSLVAGSGRLLVGDKTSTHIAIDENEIMAKGNGTTPATLNLNAEGGLVAVGAGGLDVAGTLNASGLIRVFSALAAVFGENIEYPIYMGRSQAFLGVNAYFDGTAWQRKNTSLPSSCFALNPVSGGIEIRYAAAGSGAISWTTSKVWNAANDGSDSGLDADTVDGLHSSSFFKKNAGNTCHGGNTFFATDTSGAYDTTAIQIREVGEVTNSQSADNYAPALSFHWGGINQRAIALRSNGDLVIRSAVDAGNKIWHSGNDGSGSGLDADTLDGYHVGDLCKVNNSTEENQGAMPVGSYVCVYDSTGANRPRNSLHTVYIRSTYNRDYTFDSSNAIGALSGTWRCCGVSGYYTITGTLNYLMRRTY